MILMGTFSSGPILEPLPRTPHVFEPCRGFLTMDPPETTSTLLDEEIEEGLWRR